MSRRARTTISSFRSSRPTRDALGIFGYSFLEENANKIKGAAIDGVHADL